MQQPYVLNRHKYYSGENFISVHEVAPPKYYLDLGLSYSPFSKVFACGLAHQQPSQMATRIVVINIGPCDRLIKCTHARASRVVERAPVMPVPP